MDGPSGCRHRQGVKCDMVMIDDDVVSMDG